MSKQIFWIVTSLVIAYFAVYFCDALHAFVSDIVQDPHGIEGGVLIVCAAILGIFAVCAWGIAVDDLLHSSNWRAGSGDIVGIAIVFPLFACPFGILAGPFADYGPYPWYWTSRWDVVLLIGFIPLAMLIHGVVEDIVKARREKKAPKENVTSLRRDTA